MNHGRIFPPPSRSARIRHQSGISRPVTANLLKSHLFWFVVVGVAIFVVDARYNDPQNDIVVDRGVVQRLSALWENQMERPPTAEELDGLIQNWIEEEIWYREARRLELDEEDVIIRRRLIQKAQFVAEASAPEPTDAGVRAWFEDHSDDYRLPTRYSFRQAFFRDRQTAETRGNALDDDNWRDLAQPSLLRPTHALRSRREIAGLFGESFAAALTQMSPGRDWQGPVQSEFGWHWIQLQEVRPPERPAFESVRNAVLNDYIYALEIDARRAYLEGLKDDYDIVEVHD